MTNDTPNTAQLKADIDSGRTNDKVAWSDPAASPLGTDDEAAGTPPSPARVAMARAAEVSRAPEKEEARGMGPWLWAAGIVVLIAIAAALTFIG
jgi:hypothetical protein